MEILKSRIILPEEFDERLSDPSFVEEIGGFSTYSLQFILEGMRKDLPCIPTYKNSRKDGRGTLYLCAVEKVHHQLEDYYIPLLGPERSYHKQVAHYFKEMSLRDWIIDNRRYGKFWKVYSLLREIAPHIYEVPNFSDSDFAEFIDEFIGGIRNKDYAMRLNEWVMKGFGSYEKFGEFLEEKDRWGGVQVIYKGPDELARFILEGEYEDVDEIAIYLSRPIPEKFVRYIIPLGQREREYFGV